MPRTLSRVKAQVVEELRRALSAKSDGIQLLCHLKLSPCLSLTAAKSGGTRKGLKVLLYAYESPPLFPGASWAVLTRALFPGESAQIEVKSLLMLSPLLATVGSLVFERHIRFNLSLKEKKTSICT